MFFYVCFISCYNNKQLSKFKINRLNLSFITEFFKISVKMNAAVHILECEITEDQAVPHAEYMRKSRISKLKSQIRHYDVYRKSFGQMIHRSELKYLLKEQVYGLDLEDAIDRKLWRDPFADLPRPPFIDGDNRAAGYIVVCRETSEVRFIL